MRYNTIEIQRARMKKGMSKCRLAHLIRMTPKTITNIERGTGGRPETIEKIASALGLDMEDLVIDDSPNAGTA